MSVVVADASPSDDARQIVARPQWQHSNLALFLRSVKTKRQKKGRPMRWANSVHPTYIHMEFVDLGEDPADGSVATADEDPKGIKVPE